MTDRTELIALLRTWHVMSTDTNARAADQIEADGKRIDELEGKNRALQTALRNYINAADSEAESADEYKAKFEAAESRLATVAEAVREAAANLCHSTGFDARRHPLTCHGALLCKNAIRALPLADIIQKVTP